ncbi:MAG TPA: hypothetical protein VG056_11060, partial [Pirellulales bacterium]|nr:hypothetical protein [Pirellulales bacterium]
MQQLLTCGLCLLTIGSAEFRANALEGADPAISTTPTGSLLQTFIQNPPTNFARFGEGLAGVGNDVVVGGEYAHVADVFSSSSGALLQAIPSPTPTADDGFGFSAAGSAATAFIGAATDSSVANRAGVVYAFNPADGSLLRTFRAPTPIAETEFGYALATSGTKLLVSGLSTISSPPVYLFDATTGNRLLTIPDPVQNVRDNFGSSIAFVGNNILIGAPANQSSSPLAGVAYLFDGTTGALLHTFHDPNSGGANWFGLSVISWNNNILIGAMQDSTLSVHSGAAYLFDGSTWNLLHSFFNPISTGYDFGSAVGSVGGDALIGTLDYQQGNDGGAIFGFSPGSQLLWTTPNPRPSSIGDFGFHLSTVGDNFLAAAPFDGST